MKERDVARVGVGLLIAMNVIFAWGGLDRGGAYLPLQVLGALVCVPAFRAPDRPRALAILFGGLAFVRFAQVVLELSRLSPWLNYPIMIAEVGAMAMCVAAAAAPARAPARLATARAFAWLVALLFFASMVSATGSGRIPAMAGLLCGVLGFSLVAPNLVASHARDAGSAADAAEAL